ncbi:MAG: hypothetical protein ACTSU9_03625, partial [Promethearchaeota archaeon]
IAVSVQLLDVLTSQNLTEANITSIQLVAGSVTEMFTSGNWSYSNGVVTMPLSTGSLPVGSYTVQIEVTSDSTYYFNASSTLPIWILRHDVLASITPIAPVAYGDDSLLEISIVDLITSTSVTEANISAIQLDINGTVTWYDASNWTYSSGIIGINLSTGSLSIDSYQLSAVVTLDGTYFYNSTDSIPFNIRERMVDWIVYPQLGTPEGFTTNLTFSLIDLDDPSFAYIPNTQVTGVNTTTNMALDWGRDADGTTIWVVLDTSGYLAGTVASFTLNYSSPILENKTKDVDINIVRYNMTIRFEAIPSQVIFGEDPRDSYVFWVDPDDFGKIWMSKQDDTTLSYITVTVDAAWKNTTVSIPIDPTNITMGTVSRALQTLGNYSVLVDAPDALSIGNYSIEFNISAWYDDGGSGVYSIFENVTVSKNITITKADSSNMLVSELGQVLPRLSTVDNMTFSVLYIPGSNVTYSILDANSQPIAGRVNLPMVETPINSTHSNYTATIDPLSEGDYIIRVTADPGADSNYFSTVKDLSLSVYKPFPFATVILIAMAAAVGGIVAVRAGSYLKIPKLVRIINATIATIDRGKKIKNPVIVRGLEEILNDTLEDEWALLGLKRPPFRPKSKEMTKLDANVMYKKGIKK